MPDAKIGLVPSTGINTASFTLNPPKILESVEEMGLDSDDGDLVDNCGCCDTIFGRDGLEFFTTILHSQLRGPLCTTLMGPKRISFTSSGSSSN